MPDFYPEEAQALARLMLSVSPEDKYAQDLVAWTIRHRMEVGYRSGLTVQSALERDYFPLLNENLGPETPGWEEAVAGAGDVLSSSWRDSPFEGREGVRHYWKPSEHPPGKYWSRTDIGYCPAPGWIETAREVTRSSGVRFYEVPLLGGNREDYPEELADRIEDLFTDGTSVYLPEGRLVEVERREALRFGRTYQWTVYKPSELLLRHITVTGPRQFIRESRSTEDFLRLRSDGAEWPTIEFPADLLTIEERSVVFDGETYQWKEVTVKEPLPQQIVRNPSHKLLFLGK